MANTALLAPSQHYMEPVMFDLADLRRALRNRLKVHFRYTDVVGQGSERTVRPLSLAFFGPVWLLAAWCELRDDFRTFRLDRIVDFRLETEQFRAEPGKTLHDFLKRPQAWSRGSRRLLDTDDPNPNAA
jgi:predicted DNA-binding transcriptional regulator YafY